MERRAGAGVPPGRRGLGVGAQIALARRESPHRGRQHLQLATILRSEMPCTMAAFSAGRISEWRATLLARETACLTLADRQTIDRVLAGDPARLEAMGDRELVGEAQRLAYRLDPQSFVDRRARAESERRVTLRPAPDVMSHLSALLPVKDGVAIFASLKAQADSRRLGGDQRSRDRIMADTLVERVTGRATSSEVDVMVNLVVSDEVLYGGEPGAAYVDRRAADGHRQAPPAAALRPPRDRRPGRDGLARPPFP